MLGLDYVHGIKVWIEWRLRWGCDRKEVKMAVTLAL
uniref:Uncharacterized protein n=1 Tax=Vitis vinifera TaxID=29760 RepID=F6HYR5_VITVI